MNLIYHRAVGVVFFCATLSLNVWACSNHPQGPGEHRKWSSAIEVDVDPNTGAEKTFNDAFFSGSPEPQVDTRDNIETQQPNQRRIRVYR